MSDFYQEIIEAGRQAGWQEGEKKGREKGQRELVEKLLTLRYGATMDLSGCDEAALEWAQQECLKVARFDTFKKHLHTHLQKARD